MPLSIKTESSHELKAKILDCAAVFDELPCVVIIHDLMDGSVAYMSKRGLKLLNTTMAEIDSMPHEEYHRLHFNEEDAKDYVPKLLGLLDRNNNDEMISHFQQVRFSGSDEWHWHLSSIKIFHRGADGKPRLAIAMAIPVDAMHHMTAKAVRLLEENNFLRKNLSSFSKLTNREKHILKLTALGKSAAEIAAELFISCNHGRNPSAKH
jgi:hypothetical protein